MDQSVARLLAAEKDVNEMVSKALALKNEKLRTIKEEAQGEIDRFRAEKEAEYQKELKALKDKINNEGKDSTDAGADLQKLNRDFQNNKAKVADMLVMNVVTVNIEIPKVVKGIFE